MQNLDYTSLSDDELEEARVNLTNERERRQRLANAASTVTAIAARFAEDGGDTAILVDAVTSATETPGEG